MNDMKVSGPNKVDLCLRRLLMPIRGLNSANKNWWLQGTINRVHGLLQKRQPQPRIRKGKKQSAETPVKAW